MKTYKKEALREISFPLGGMGAGSIGLAGNGRLRDWEIYNRPFKNSANAFSHIMVRAEKNDEVQDVRALQGDWTGGAIGGETVNIYRGCGGFGLGHGPYRGTMAGVPHFKECTFHGEYPLAALDFTDECFPGEVKLLAFNPFIPLNDKDSSLPAAFFEVEFYNTTDEALDYTAMFTLNNPLPHGSGVNRVKQANGQTRIEMTSDVLEGDEVLYGNLCLATDAEDVSWQESWLRGLWFDELVTFWHDVHLGGRLPDRHYETTKGAKKPYQYDGEEHGTLAAHLHLAPGERKTARFVVGWFFPNCENYWGHRDDESIVGKTWKHYYAGQFADAADCAGYALANWQRLYDETKLFHDALYATTLPDYCLEAVSANMSILKTATCLRLTDGELYGFEGSDANWGSCEGSCQHVWNYAYALPFLFPAVERTMRDLDYRYNQREDGGMSFRLKLPLGSGRFDFRPCVDGQMGVVVQTWRDYLLSGDLDWLRGKWPHVKKAIEFAWAPTNDDGWDLDKDGVMEGRQHHTLDMELFGPSSWLNGFYLAALRAGEEMAALLGHEAERAEYRALFERGKAWCDENLFNGDYYEHKVDLKDKDLLLRYDKGGKSLEGDGILDSYWSDEAGEMQYQVANGCLVDQVIGQWHANLCGLGEIFDEAQTQKALEAIYRYNFKTARNNFNPARVYCLDDEKCVRVCGWPEDAVQPRIPITYAEECFNGMEYQAAVHMLQIGMQNEAFAIIKAIRDRFDGSIRNPWDEFECGSNYARSMASYALIPAASGFTYDLARGHIGFAPVVQSEEGDFTSFFSTGTGWGTVRFGEEGVQLNLLYGSLTLQSLGLPNTCLGGIAKLNDTTVTVTPGQDALRFGKPVTLCAGDTLTLTKTIETL